MVKSDCVDHNKLLKILRDGNTRPSYLPPAKPVYAGQEATVRTGYGIMDGLKKEYVKNVYCHPVHLTLHILYVEYNMQNVMLDDSEAGIKMARRNINNLIYADDSALMEETKEQLKSLLMWVKEE